MMELRNTANGSISVDKLIIGMDIASPLVWHELPLDTGETFKVSELFPINPHKSDYVTVTYIGDDGSEYVRRYAPRSLLFRR